MNDFVDHIQRYRASLSASDTTEEYQRIQKNRDRMAQLVHGDIKAELEDLDSALKAELGVRGQVAIGGEPAGSMRQAIRSEVSLGQRRWVIRFALDPISGLVTITTSSSAEGMEGVEETVISLDQFRREKAHEAILGFLGRMLPIKKQSQ